MKTATAIKSRTIANQYDSFRVLCAWCGTEIKAPKCQGDGPAPESHGICVPCAVRLGMPPDYFDQQRNVA